MILEILEKRLEGIIKKIINDYKISTYPSVESLSLELPQKNKHLKVTSQTEDEPSIYHVTLSYLREEVVGYSLDENKGHLYAGLRGRENATKLSEFVLDKFPANEDYPIRLLMIFKGEKLDHKKEEFPYPIQEHAFSTENKEETIHQLTPNLFVRKLYLCDITKNWDYEPF